MIYGIYQSAAGLRVQEYRQSIVANNLANVDTPGFKPDGVALLERPVESADHADARLRAGALDRLSGGLHETATYTDFSDGSLDFSGNPLDLALVGPGFFRVATESGERYTRDGRLTKREDGLLVTVAGGRPILDVNGREIRLDPRSRGKVGIDESGLIRQGPVEVAQVGVAGFDNLGVLNKVGRNLYEALGGAEARRATGEIHSGAVEQSGADPITSLTTMIAATRAYELNATLISYQDSTLGRVVNDVGRLG